jgi:chemotaxis protein methyltransferase CheR
MAFIKWKNHHVEDVEVELLLVGLKQRYGYDFTGYARASMKRRLQALCQHFAVSHMTSLLPTMLYDEAVAQKIIGHIVVPTSEFFRDGQVWKVVREQVIPILDSFPRINIWQVGCGRGEEAYTLAILLHETGLLHRARIFASDINAESLREARCGEWPRQRMVEWRANYASSGGTEAFDSYFTERGETVCIDHQLKNCIEYVEHNLVVDDVFKEMQLVVCRNVLIYFGQQLQDRVLNLLTRSLERGGFLMLGKAESILDLEQTPPDLERLTETSQLYRKRVARECHV